MATTNKSDAGRRPERVASRVRDELAAALTHELTDPRLAGVVVADVQVTADLSQAHVSIVVMGDDDAGSRAEQARKVLATLEGRLRKRIAPALAMRRVPALRFQVDRSRAETERLDKLLHEVGEELKKRG